MSGNGQISLSGSIVYKVICHCNRGDRFGHGQGSVRPESCFNDCLKGEPDQRFRS